MAQIKSYTSLEQSKVLAKILPLESADMSWVPCDNGKQRYYQVENQKIVLNYEKKHWIPCWSLAALLCIIKEVAIYTIQNLNNNKVMMVCEYEYRELWENYCGFVTQDYENEIDACYEAVIKLHELKML